VTIYYPGTRDPGAAAQLDVAPGAQLRNIDVTMTKAHTVRVRGRVVGEAAEMGRGFQVVLMSAGGGPHGTGASPSGEFEIAGVVPGSYVLMANAGRGGRSTTVRRPIEVGNANIEGLVLTMTQAVSVTGRVRVDGQSTQAPGKIMVRLQPYEPGSFLFGPLPNAQVGADGSFKLDNVSADRYSVSVAGLPEGYYVKSISSANVDVLAAGLDVGASAPAPLDIVLSPNAGQVTGTVQNAAAQQPAAGVTVVLIPQERERRENASFYKTTVTDASGRFTFRSLVPGNYRLYAFEDVESGAWFDPDFMRQMEAKGEAVTVSEGSREDLQITLIPAD
jgi:5-hydroxyisourate hydrolase-like protein (transthyretin family)